MAYTITQPSNTWVPSENLSWYTADSTDKNESSFVYRFRVQVTDPNTPFTTGTTGSDVVGTFRVPPRPVSGDAQFSPNAIIKNYVTTPLDYTLDEVAGSTGDAIKKYRIVFGQEYVTTSGATGMDSVTGATGYIWNSVIKDELFPSYDQYDYVLKPTPTNLRQFLTDGPTTRCISENDHLYVLGGTGTTNLNYTRDQNEIFNNKTVFSTGLSSWKQTRLYTPARNWYLLAPSFLYATAQALFPVGEFSDVLFFDDVFNTPKAVSGPIRPGDEFSIEITSPIPYAQAANTNGLFLWGRNLDGTWESIIELDKDLIYSTVITFRKIGYVFTKHYQYIGFAVKNEGLTYWPGIDQVRSAQLKTRGFWFWKRHNAGSIFQPVENDAINWVNTGTNGMGQVAYVTTGVTPTDNYDILVVDTETNAYTEAITYDGDCNSCTNCESVKLIWLNSLGGYDEFEFACIQNKSLEVERVIGDRTLTPGYVRGQRGRLNTSNVAQRIKTVNTQYTTANDIDWLESLFMSPDVYEVSDTGVLTPVIVDSESYSQYVTQDKLKIAEFSYSIGYLLKSQIL